MRQGPSSITGEDFEARLGRPNLPALEGYFGHPLPGALRALYGDMALVASSDLQISVANPVVNEPKCYVAWFEPGDLQTLVKVPVSCSGLFPFAGNGAGDQYFVDPKQPDPEVMYFLHETESLKGLGIRLSEFLAAPRGPVDPI